MVINVSARFSGPIGFANGGWIGGLLAANTTHEPPMVTLRKPIPLETNFDYDGETLTLKDTVLAEVATGEFTYPVPAAVDVRAAKAAEAASPVQANDNYGQCLVCGVERPDGFGLKPGPVQGRPDTVACTWRPGRTNPPLPLQQVVPSIWGALDCPGAWTTDLINQPMLLGRMTVRVLTSPDLSADADATYVVVGHREGASGRKVYTTTALYTDTGELLAHAEATWITVTAHPRSRE